MIFFDFDGTIVDVWKRYYNVFCDAAQTEGIISIEKYIEMKKKYSDDSALAMYLGIKLPDDYYVRKRALLECMAYLKHDELLVSQERIVKYFMTKECRLLTKRRIADNLRQQLISLGLERLIEYTIVLNPDDGQSKREYINKYFGGQDIVIIGDSKEEWDVSKNKEAKVFLVETGLRNPKDFPQGTNVYLVSDINACLEML